MDEATPTERVWVSPSHRRGGPPERSPCEVIMGTPKWNGRDLEPDDPKPRRWGNAQLDYVM